MNIGSKSKKRVVLPSRPEPPTVEQILEDMSRAGPDDPVFTVLEQSAEDASRLPDRDVQLRYQQVRRFLELQERLQEAGRRLEEKREELKAAGIRLDADVQWVKDQTLAERNVPEIKGQTGTETELTSPISPDTDSAR